MDFKIKGGEAVRSRKCTIASATVIEKGDLVELDTGLIVKATATGTAVAYALEPSASGDVLINVTEGNDFTLLGTSDADFAVTDKGIECDIVGTTTQLIDLGESSTDVLKVSMAEDAGTVGSKLNIEVRINKPLF